MKYVKHIVSIILVVIVILTKSLTVYGVNDNILPSVGVTQLVRDIEITDELIAQIKEQKEKAYSEEDLKLVSCIIWHEAGNQCEAGKQSVGIVVMNRLNDEKTDWGSTVEEVLYKPHQFVTKTDKRMLQALSMYEQGILPTECIEAAIYALEGNKIVVYEGKEIDMSSYHYFNGHWDDARLRIQDHDFK